MLLCFFLRSLSFGYKFTCLSVNFFLAALCCFFCILLVLWFFRIGPRLGTTHVDGYVMAFAIDLPQLNKRLERKISISIRKLLVLMAIQDCTSILVAGYYKTP